MDVRGVMLQPLASLGALSKMTGDLFASVPLIMIFACFVIY